MMNIPLVRSQLRGAQILDAVRLYKNGFPEHLSFAEFWRKFHNLGSAEMIQRKPSHDEMKQAVKDLLEVIDLDSSSVRLGNTQVRI